MPGLVSLVWYVDSFHVFFFFLAGGTDVVMTWQMNRRPRLTDELESLISSDEPTMTGSDSSLAAASETDAEMLKFLVDLFVQCTDGNPSNRPTAVQVYEMLCSVLPLPDPKS